METKPRNFKTDKQWSDKFIPEIKSIVGRHILDIAPIEEDMERNTDLIVLGINGVRIGCRVRTHDYLRGYGDQFTIRAGRPNGRKTELTKIFEGWGNYFFYGFSNCNESGLEKWFLGDLIPFRIWFFRELYNKTVNPNYKCRWEERKNGDGSSSFMAFKLSNMPKNFIVLSSNQG